MSTTPGEQQEQQEQRAALLVDAKCALGEAPANQVAAIHLREIREKNSGAGHHD